MCSLGEIDEESASEQALASNSNHTNRSRLNQLIAGDASITLF